MPESTVQQGQYTTAVVAVSSVLYPSTLPVINVDQPETRRDIVRKDSSVRWMKRMLKAHAKVPEDWFFYLC